MELTIPNTVKNFIKDYSELINDPNQYKELVRVANESLYNNDLVILFFMLKGIGINLDDYRWEIFDNTFLKGLISLKQTMKYIDPSKSWSRLQYILEDTEYQGFAYEEIVAHLIKVKSILNIKMEPLEPEYGWEGPGDYNLGWFDKEEFRKEHPEDFDDQE